MKAIKNKTSILLTGFFSGLNFFCFTTHQDYVSKILGSMNSVDIELSGNNGFQKDATMLKRDWINVRKDLMSSFNSLENDIPTTKS